jgi:prepilin-type N-terminal cleavage/methylation domain-containing protein
MRRQDPDRSHPAGFTLIEVLVAFALAVSMLVAVYATTQAAAKTAERQKAGSREDAQWLRFEQVVRRDLRGSLATGDAQAGGATASASDGEQAFLSFTTTADSALAGEDGNVTVRRAIQVRYVTRPGASGVDVVRVEDRPGLAALETPLLRVPAEPVIESFDGVRWSAGFRPSSRPAALRLTVGGRITCVRL